MSVNPEADLVTFILVIGGVICSLIGIRHLMVVPGLTAAVRAVAISVILLLAAALVVLSHIFTSA